MVALPVFTGTLGEEREDRFDVPGETWTENQVEGYWSADDVAKEWGVEDDGESVMVWLGSEGEWTTREEWEGYIQARKIEGITYRCLNLGCMPEGLTSEWACPDQEVVYDDDIPF